jgi:hypothetical protein
MTFDTLARLRRRHHGPAADAGPDHPARPFLAIGHGRKPALRRRWPPALRHAQLSTP